STDGFDVDGVIALYGCESLPIIYGDCNAVEVFDHTLGTMKNGIDPIGAGRSDASKALGAPERTNSEVFLSLGYGGSVTLAYGGAIPNGPGDDLEIVETTYGFS